MSDRDVLDFGADREPRAWGWLRRPLTRRLAAGAAVIILAVAGAVVLTARSHSPRPAAGGRHAAASTRGGPWYAVGAPVVVKSLHHPVLGEHTDWQLFAVEGGWEPGAESGAVVRIQMATGLVTRTAMPPLASSGLAAVIAGPDQVIVRPADYVPGYLVPDGGAARGLPAGLGQGGMTYPGPRPGQVWVAESVGARVDGYSVLRLVTMTGARVGQSTLDLPASGFLSVPDGQGYALVQGGDAVYDVRLAGARRVATGTLAAVGPSAWLVSRCRGASHSASHCVSTVIDPATGSRHTLPGSALAGYPIPSWPPGVISPDGRLAALPSYGKAQSAAVRFVDLRTGAEHSVTVAFGGQGWPALAWSPDSRWLLWVTASGAVQAMDPRTGQVCGLGVALPPVTFLATRGFGVRLPSGPT